MGAKRAFNFVSDHMTLLVEPPLYKLFYAFVRVVLCAPKGSIIYEKRKRWPGSPREASMTFAANIGEVARERSLKTARTAIAVVQPTEPEGQGSHVRDMLRQHSAAAHWQHIALRTPDLMAFHSHALAHGVNFITPLMKDSEEDLLQVFTGELFLPGTAPSGVFFEFVQRDVTKSLLEKIRRLDRQSWFRDRTFLGLYGEKEQEYRGGTVQPLWDHSLMERLSRLWEGKELWEVTEKDVQAAAALMREHASSKGRRASAAA